MEQNRTAGLGTILKAVIEVSVSVYCILSVQYVLQSMLFSIILMHLNNTDKLGPIKRGYDYSALSKESAKVHSSACYHN